MSKELIAKFVTHLDESGKSQSTVVAYRKDLHQLREHIEDDLHTLEFERLNNAIQELQNKHEFTPKTVSRKINSYRTFYRFLVDQGHSSHNPAEKIEHPKFTSKPPRVLSQMEFLALREVSRSNRRLHAMIELMLQTGIRIGELSRLKLKHTQLQRNRFHIEVEPHSTAEGRRIPLNNRAAELLREYVESDLSENPEEHPLFATRDGKHIIIRNIRSSIDRAMVKAGIEDACVNDLRNTFIVRQLQSGVPIEFVAEVVGHRSKTTTQKYLELLEDKYSPRGETIVVEV